MAYYPVSDVIGRLPLANFNSTADQMIRMPARYIISTIWAAGSSVSLTLAAGGIYTRANKTGIVIVPATQAYATLTGPLRYLQLTLSVTAQTTIFTDTTIFLSLTVPQGSIATGRILVFGKEV